MKGTAPSTSLIWIFIARLYRARSQLTFISRGQVPGTTRTGHSRVHGDDAVNYLQLQIEAPLVPRQPTAHITWFAHCGNHSTTSVYSAPLDALKLFNLPREQLVALTPENLSDGSYQVGWDESGFASGPYFYRLRAESFSETKKLILLR